MNAEIRNSIYDIASIHEKRINEALEHLKDTFPVTEESVQKLSDEEFVYMELLTSRFSKLQDHLGAQAFAVYFKAKNEDVSNLTMIDKLNKLEKFGIIDNTMQWREMRDARNIVAHEYPDNPKLIADTLNLIKKYCADLIAIKNRLFESI